MPLYKTFLAKIRNTDSYENISRKQLESIFTKPSESISDSKSTSKAKKKSAFKTKLKSTPKSKSEAKSKPERKPTELMPILNLDEDDELEKMEIAINRSLSKLPSINGMTG